MHKQSSYANRFTGCSAEVVVTLFLTQQGQRIHGSTLSDLFVFLTFFISLPEQFKPINYYYNALHRVWECCHLANAKEMAQN